MRYTVATKVKNEGPFLLEWVAWQRMLGFTDILVVHNDCDPEFKEMLYTLENAGWITQAEHSPRGNMPPGKSAHQCIRAHDLIPQTDWFFMCDVDEYLVPHNADHSVQTLLKDKHLSFCGMVVQWKSFGSNGFELWEDAFLHRTFLNAAPEKHKANGFYKSFLYKPDQFRGLGAHEPQGFVGAGAWGDPPNRFCHANGSPLDFDPDGEPRKRTTGAEVSHSGAQLNHYIIKWLECFSLKAGRPSLHVRHGKPRYSPRFLRAYDQNDDRSLAALTLTNHFQVIYDQLLDVPNIKRLHHLNCASYVKRLNEVAETDFESDPRYATHIAAAEATP